MRSLVILSFLFYMASAGGQNLIGYKDGEIMKFMKENKRDMRFNKVNNADFIYLKYSDVSESQTMLFFLNRDSVCQSIRIICDANAKAQKVKEFNSIYKQKSENRWTDNRNGKKFLIELKDDRWSSIITMKPGK